MHLAQSSVEGKRLPNHTARDVLAHRPAAASKPINPTDYFSLRPSASLATAAVRVGYRPEQKLEMPLTTQANMLDRSCYSHTAELIMVVCMPRQQQQQHQRDHRHGTFDAFIRPEKLWIRTTRSGFSKVQLQQLWVPRKAHG